MTPKEVAAAFVAAHNAHDVDKMMSYLTEDSVMIDVAAPIPLDSKKDVRKLYEMIFAAIDINFEITGMIAEGNKVFAAIRTTGSGIGIWMGKDLKGAKCEVFEGMFAEIRGNQIEKTMFYSDTATISQQLGDYSPAIDMDPIVSDIM